MNNINFKHFDATEVWSHLSVRALGHKSVSTVSWCLLCTKPLNEPALKIYHQKALQWCHNECNGISNHQRPDSLLNRLFRRRSKKTSKLCITGLCLWGESTLDWWYPSQRASNVENDSIWRHHGLPSLYSSEMLFEILTFSFRETNLKMPFWPGFNLFKISPTAGMLSEFYILIFIYIGLISSLYFVFFHSFDDNS